MPAAIVRSSAVEHNAAVMAEFCRRAGAELMPHAKTALSPQLVARQLHHGATGMTAATPHQALRLWDWGVDQVLVANQITAPAELAALLRARTGARRLWHYVDSLDGIEVAVEAARRAGDAPPGDAPAPSGGAGRTGRHGGREEQGAQPVEVLVELGHDGGRTGARTVTGAMALAEAVVASPELRLVGVAGYEGLLGGDRDQATFTLVDTFLRQLARLARRVRALIEGPLVVTAGGSAHFDRVVAALGPVVAADPGRSRLVLRSGCYLTHDHGLYRRRSPAAAADWPLPPFRPAIEVWARVLSRPEPELVLLNAGRRDLSHDADLPVPLATIDPADTTGATANAAEPGRGPAPGPVEGWTVTGLSDQHTFVRVPSWSTVAVGQLVALGISHPCTTFDRWSTLWLVDDGDRILAPLTTSFG